MSNSKEFKMPSGAMLRITIAPFEDARALYQSILDEVKALRLDPKSEIDVNLYKDLFCIGFSSKKIESCLDKCFQRVTYNNLKVTKDTWEDVEARQDYMQACIEVAKENILPFVKGLSAEYLTVFQAIVGSPALRPETTTQL